MKKKYVSLLLFIIVGIGILCFIKPNGNLKKEEAKSTTNYPIDNISDLQDGDSLNLDDENSLDLAVETTLEETSKNKTKIVTDKQEVSYKEQETKNMNSNNISISFFYAKNTDELVKWIKNADNNDERKHFLDVARQKKEILTVEATNSKYKLQSITVHPNHEYMTYTFKNDLEYIDVIINLSDSMKQQMTDSLNIESIDKVVSEYNKELDSIYKDFKLKEGKAKILETSIDIFYNDGKYYKKLDGQLKLIVPSVFFEFKNTEIRMNLYGALKEKKWDNKYLKLFDFKIVQL